MDSEPGQVTSPLSDAISTESPAMFRSRLEFQQILHDRAITPSFQPIVNPFSGTVLGYEVQVRSTRDGRRGAADLCLAASRVGMEDELSALTRSIGMIHARFLPSHAIRFLNTHASEIAGSKLLASLTALRENDPDVPIVLEIHESSISEPPLIKEFNKQLQQLDIGLAYEGFGQGESRILEFIEAPPDFLKFNIELIRGIHVAAKSRQKLLASLVQLARDLGTLTIAEGVEALPELEVCKQLGVDLVQGYYSGRPQPVEWILADLVNGKTNPETTATRLQQPLGRASKLKPDQPHETSFRMQAGCR